MVSYSPCGSSIPETSVEPARLSVPVGVEGGVPVALTLALSQETPDSLKDVGLMLAALVLVGLLVLVLPQAAAPVCVASQNRAAAGGGHLLEEESTRMNHRGPHRVYGSHRQVGNGLLRESARRCASNMAHDPATQTQALRTTRRAR